VKAIVSAMSVMLAVCILDGAWAGTWYVDAAVKGGDGTSWEKAFKKIQAGIDKAADGDTVVVAQGTYVENIKFGGKNIVLTSTEPLNWGVVAKTIIDGNKAGSVVTFYGPEDETCVLSGFTIRNGTGTYAPTRGWEGGGIYGWTAASSTLTHATIENNVITGNDTGTGGALCYCDGLVRNNIIWGNSATRGGGIADCDGTIENNLIVANSSGLTSGGVGWCNAMFRNNVVVGNSAPLDAGGLGHVGTSEYGPPGGAITNCIIWGNSSPTDPQVHYSLAPTYCCIQDWTGGGHGNITVNPQFVDPDGPDDDPNTFEDNDYRLLPTSICIDTGKNEDWMNGATDLDGSPRILVGASSITVDIGAYEYRFDLAIGRDVESVQLSWTMRPQTIYTVLSSFDVTAQPWAEETTILGGKTGGPAVWIDPSASSALKFYKIGIE